MITASANAGASPVPGVTVHVHARRRTLSDVYLSLSARFKKRSSGSATDAAAPAQETSSPATPAHAPRAQSLLWRALAQLRGAIGMSMFLPDHARGWVLRAARVARGLLRSQPFDVVLSSGPPHSAHLAGVFATLGRREPLWIDLRDPWSQALGDAQWDLNRSRLQHALVPRLERFVFRHARRVVANTTELATMLRGDPKAPPVTHLPNGIDTELLPVRTAERLAGCSIAYVGTVYGARNVSAVLAAMRELIRARPDAAQRLRFRIAGHVGGVHRDRLLAEIAAHDVGECVELLGVVSRSDALTLLRRSHLALVLAQGQHMMVPAKLYECVGLSVPTLVLTEHTSATAREAQRIGAMTLAGDDADGIRAVLEQALDGRLPSETRPTAPISHADLARELDAALRALVVREAARPAEDGVGAVSG